MGMGFSTQQNVFFNLLDVIVIAVICLFMLLDCKRLWNLIVRVFSSGLREDLTRAIQNSFLGFFSVGCCYQSSSASLPLWCLFCLIFPMHWSWQQLQAHFTWFPVLAGATIGISLICLIILPQGILLSLKVLVVCIVLQQVEENLLRPRSMRDSININPVIMFFALL